MAELWRELPDLVAHPDGYSARESIWTMQNETACGYESPGGIKSIFDWFHNVNPANALAELLIWARRRGRNENR